jgi:hypothetical protein
MVEWRHTVITLELDPTNLLPEKNSQDQLDRRLGTLILKGRVIEILSNGIEKIQKFSKLYISSLMF